MATAVTLYEHINYGGASLTLSHDEDELSDHQLFWIFSNWNDKTSSIVVAGNGPDDGATFYTDNDYRGDSVYLPPGDYNWVEALGIPNDSISSLDLV